jgi:sphingolipid 4-desaturase/C4-monooxygenase
MLPPVHAVAGAARAVILKTAVLLISSKMSACWCIQVYGEGTCYELPPPPITFKVVDHMQPHPERKRSILTAHPEIEELYGFEWKTKYLAVLLAAANLSIAAYVGTHWAALPLWGVFLVAYLIGAPVNHACSMIIHDCAHDLAASTPALNRWIGMLANLPLAVPSAMR